MTYTVVNIDGEPVGTYDTAEGAKEATRDLAEQAAQTGDVTNGYSVLELEDFPGHLAQEFSEEKPYRHWMHRPIGE